MFNSDAGMHEKIEALANALQEMQNQRKIVELDLEKRVLMLESLIEDLKKGKIAPEAGAEPTGLKALEQSLHDLEDISLIERLEVINSRDDLEQFKEEISVMKEKVDLLVDAIEILSDKVTTAAEETEAAEGQETETVTARAPSSPEIEKLAQDVALLKQKIGQLNVLIEGGVPAQTSAGDAENIPNIRFTMRDIEKNFNELVSTVKEYMDLQDKKLGIIIGDIDRFEQIQADINKVRGELEDAQNREERFHQIITTMTNAIKNVEGKEVTFEQKIDEILKNFEKEKVKILQLVREGYDLQVKKFTELDEKTKELSDGLTNEKEKLDLLVDDFETTRNKIIQLVTELNRRQDLDKEFVDYLNISLTTRMEKLDRVEIKKINDLRKEIDSSLKKSNELLSSLEADKNEILKIAEDLFKEHKLSRELIADIEKKSDISLTKTSEHEKVVDKLREELNEERKRILESTKALKEEQTLSKKLIETVISKEKENLKAGMTKEFEKIEGRLKESITANHEQIQKSFEQLKEEKAKLYSLINENVKVDQAKFAAIDDSIEKLKLNLVEAEKAENAKVENALNAIKLLKKDQDITKESIGAQTKEVKFLLSKVQQRNLERFKLVKNETEESIKDISAAVKEIMDKVEHATADADSKFKVAAEMQVKERTKVIDAVDELSKEIESKLDALSAKIEDENEKLGKETHDKYERLNAEVKNEINEMHELARNEKEERQREIKELMDLKGIKELLEGTRKTKAELEKIVNQKELDDFFIHYGEMKILKDSLKEEDRKIEHKIERLKEVVRAFIESTETELNGLKATDVSNKDDIRSGVKTVLKEELADSIENIKEMSNQFKERLKAIKAENEAELMQIKKGLLENMNKVEEMEKKLDIKIAGVKTKLTAELQAADIKAIIEESNKKNIEIISNMQRVIDKSIRQFEQNKQRIDELESVMIEKGMPTTKEGFGTDLKGVNERLARLERENQELKNKLEDIKRAYYRVVTYEHSVPVVIE